MEGGWLDQMISEVFSSINGPVILYAPNFIQLSYEDVKVSSMYGLFVLLATCGLDLQSIMLSHIMIIKTTVSIASKEENVKALNTYVSHIWAVLIYYILMIYLSTVYRFGKHVSPLVHVFMANIHSL